MNSIWCLKACVAAAVGAVALAAGSAEAAPLPAGGMTIQETEAWLKGLGYTATAHPNDNYVEVMVSDQKVAVFTADCTNGRCRSLQYFYGISYNGGYTPDDATAAIIINSWNANYRWYRVYVDKDRNPGAEMDVSISPGVDSEGLDDSFKTFVSGMPEFRKFLEEQRPKK
jgi:hypothetical protein